MKQAEVRFRQEGHIYFGEAFIVPSREDNLTDRVESLKKKLREIDWRIFDVTIMDVKELEPE